MAPINYIRLAIPVIITGALAFLLWRLDVASDKLEKKEAEITRLESDKKTIEGNLAQAIATNKANEEFLKQSVEQALRAQAIATSELQAYKARDTQFRSILNDLNRTPVEDRSPVSRIVCATVDRLYSDTGPSASACPD